MVTLMPLVFLLLFVYVFGGTLGSGLGSAMPGAEAALSWWRDARTPCHSAS